MTRNYEEENIYITLAEYLVAHKATIRTVAQEFKIPKSTVHYAITSKLCRINPVLYKKVRKILDKHKKDAPYNGGKATKKMYAAKRRSMKVTHRTIRHKKAV